MPKISKTLKAKTVKPKNKSAKVLAKPAPVKKKIVKKVVAKKVVKKMVPEKIIPKKSNKVVVDVISDEENFPNTADFKETVPVFSSWPNFNKTTETTKGDVLAPADDIYKEVDEASEDAANETVFANPQIENNFGEKVIPADDENLDKQKKFFSDWAAQIKPVEGQEKPTLAPNKKSIRLYRRQAFLYLGATLILLLAVFYLFFSKLTVSISPQGEIINDSLSLNIEADASSNSAAVATTTDSTVDQNSKIIDGDVKVVDFSAEKTYQTSGEAVTSDVTSEVTGVVTLINRSNKNQPLVVKTRLLSPDGKLFRLKESVNIPAGGSVTANVYADKPSIDMAISTPTRFTIPGLWAGLQTQIYAENSDAFTFQNQTKKYIKQSDLDQAKQDISDVLALKVKNDLSTPRTDEIVVYGDNDGTVSTEFSAKIGEEKPEFTVKAVKKVAVVTFSKEKAAALAQARLSLLVSDDKQLIDFDKNKITYTLDSFDPNTKTAVVKSYFGGSMSLKSDSTLIDRKKLVGLSRQQISEYLNGFPEIKSYNLNFSPSFISTAPTLPDRINIKIQN